MRRLAELIMRGRTQAILVAIVAAILPLFYWISAAVVGLVTLRRGPAEGMNVLAWTLLPAGFWAMNGDPTPITVIIGTAILAWVLRSTVSWSLTLAALLLVGVVSGLAIERMLGEMLTQVIEVAREMVVQPAAKDATFDAHWWHQLVAGGLGAANAATMLGSLALARWWQATLYNPGGFRQEFHQLRLSPAMALLILAALVLGPHIGLETVRWMPLLVLPLMCAGLALVHGSMAKRELGRTWLIVFYTAVTLLGPYVIMLLVLLAVVDSLVDIRRRIPAKT